MRRKLAAMLAAVAITGGGVAVYAAQSAQAVPAKPASVMFGNHIEIGCSTPFDVLVYTVVDNDGNPTGSMDALGWACHHGDTGGLDLQNYVRVGQDQFDNVVVREYPGRRATGTPIAISVVPFWDRDHEH